MKRIKQISVTNLFGMFNHTILFNRDDRITIIHGPNGFGKTAILRLLNDLFCSSNSTLRKMPFSEFRVEFDDNTSVWMVKNYHSRTEETEKESPISEKVTFHANGPGKEKHTFALTLKPSITPHQLALVERRLALDRVGPETWRYLPTGEVLS